MHSQFLLNKTFFSSSILQRRNCDWDYVQTMYVLDAIGPIVSKHWLQIFSPQVTPKMDIGISKLA